MTRLTRTLHKATAAAAASAVLLCTLPKVSADGAPVILNDAEWNAFVEEKMELDSVPGMTLAAVSGSETGFKSWGYANIGEQSPVTEDTVFGIGSCSKAFTALTIFLLQEEGRLSIEDSVSDYLPWWHVTWQGEDRDTKIWQLLNHCSGIPDTTMMKFPIGTDDSLKEETARIAEDIRLVYEPATAFEYCNLGYDVLAYITETVSGMPFEEYVRQEIFLPIGMMSSGYDTPTAQGYRIFFGSMTEYDEPFFRGCCGDGGIRSTAKDMSLWLNAQLGNTELPEKLRNAIAASHETHDAHRSGGEQMTEYFYGWNHYNGYMFHSGTIPSFSSYIIIDPERSVGIFTSANAWVYTADYGANSLYQIMKGEPINKEQLDIPDLLGLIDTVSVCITVIGIIEIASVIVLTLTRKKRLAGRETTYKKERGRLCRRLTVLIPAFCLSVICPNILTCFMGYGAASYRMVGVWLPYSFLVAFFVTDAALLAMIASSIGRFIHCKRTAR